MSNAISDALTRYWEVIQMPEFKRELFVPQAYEGLSALLQILSCLAESDRYEVPFILPNDEALFMYIGLVQMYSNKEVTFEDFCHKHFGLYFHFHQLDESGLTSVEVLEAGGDVYTLGQLQADFDTELSSLASSWAEQWIHGKLKPGAIIWGRARKSEMTPTQYSSLLKIINRWNGLVN